MQSASPKQLSDLKAEFDREVMWERVRAALGEGRLIAFILVALLTLSIADSTATAQWVSGIGVITGVALFGAVLLGLLAILPIPWPAALAAGFVVGPVIAFAVSWPSMHAAHPTDRLDLRLIGTWLARISDGTAASDTSFFLFLICCLMWLTGAWMSWCVLRWRKPLLGLIPGAAAFATNVLNFPNDQNGYTLAMLVFTLALLLWTNYTGSIANASRAHVKMTGDAKWDFWESGLIAMAGLIVLAILMPPMSTVDKTVDLESSTFSSWAQLQQRLNHPGPFNGSPGGSGTTGFSTDVHLGTPLTRTRDIAFEYTLVGDPGTRYFRGVDVTLTQNGEWRYAGSGVREALGKDEPPPYAENYSALALTQFNVKMVRPPIGNSDVLFYPGQLYKVNRQTFASQVPIVESPQGTLQLNTLDRLSSVSPSTSAGSYVATVEYSTASVAQLQAAGTDYPDWLKSYMTLPRDYRPPDVLAEIHDLALKVVRDAGLDPATASPYDEATAIEEYLRGSAFAYTLDPPSTPTGMDQMDWFLFKSPSPHAGYCEYFATAMGDMLRSLGIPTRLVNGFGPGQFDSTVEAYVVRGEDAHTWVESYFPNYGWIPFEPTNDNVYFPIQRGAPANACLRDENCADPTQVGPAGLLPGSQVTPHSGGRNEPANSGGGGGLQVSGIRLDASALTKIVGIAVAIVLLLLAVAARYLRPRTVAAVWRRTLALARLAGAERRPGETPLELGRRLQRTFPEAAEPVGALARGFVVAAYAPPDVASSSRASVMDAWVSLRPMLLRRVFARFRPGRME